MTNNRKQQEIVYFSFLFSNLSKTRGWVFNKYCELHPQKLDYPVISCVKPVCYLVPAFFKSIP